MNKDASLKVFQVLTGFISVYHLILAILGTFGSSTLVINVITSVYGVSPDSNLQFLYLVKFVAIYFLVVSLVAAFITYKPAYYADLVWVLVTLFVVRIVERIVFYDLLNAAFGTSFERNMMVVIPLVILTCLLIGLKPKSASK